MTANPHAISVKNAYQISPPPVDLPDGMVRPAAVFLVNVMGLTEFFQSRGDVAGKDMLHRFHNISSAVVAENGGVIAKTAGDSVWAHFADPRNALLGAVALQNKFDVFNRERASRRDRILIRIGIHYGDVISEKEDLLGNVVNLIREVLPNFDAGQVCITREMFDLVGSDAHVPLKPVYVKGAGVPAGLRLYEVVWNETPSSAPALSSPTTLYVRPLWRMVESGFREAWEELISERPSSGRHPLPPKRVLADRSVVFATGGVPRSINKARNVLAFINSRPAAGRMPLVPVQIIVDAGTYFTIDGTVSRESDINWSEMAAGEIYISPAAHSRLLDTENLNFEPHASGKFYRFIDKKRRPPASPVSFPFGGAMFQGSNPPCFYCGLRRHPSMSCPSKMLGGKRDVLESLGYLSPGMLSKLFFGYLTGERGAYSKIHSANVTVSYDMAAEGALELLYVHQLRFFALLWGAEGESWDKVVNGRSGGGAGRKGGGAWLALDCIRSSNHPQAETLLDRALERTPHDFRVYCIMGYLHIEQDNLARAADDFVQALYYADTKPQRIFIRFMLFRLCCLSGRMIDAEKHIDEIFVIDSRCLDAVFHSAVFSFRRGEEDRAMAKILGLVHDDRRYFIRALIAPELAPFHPAIARKLGRVYENARRIAEAGMQIAEIEMDRLKTVLGEMDRFFGEMTSLWKKTQELYASESYFGALDAAHTAAAVVSGAQREIRRRREYLYQLLSELNERSFEISDAVKTLPDEGTCGTFDTELKSIQSAIDAIRKDVRLEESGAFKKAAEKSKAVSEKLKNTGARLEFLKNFQMLRNFIFTFFRVSLIFQPINLLIGIILLPLVLRYFLSGVITGGAADDHLRLCQFGAVFVGGAAGFIYATVKGLEHIQDE